MRSVVDDVMRRQELDKMAIAASDLAKDMFRIIDEKGVATCILITPRKAVNKGICEGKDCTDCRMGVTYMLSRDDY